MTKNHETQLLLTADNDLFLCECKRTDGTMGNLITGWQADINVLCAPCAGPWFSVEGKNEERGVAGVSYLRKLYVTVNGITVTLMKAGRTLVSMDNLYPSAQWIMVL